MTDLPRDLRAALDGRLHCSTTPAVAHRETSSDGTEKFLLRLADGRHIESVFIPDTPADDLLHLDAGRAARWPARSA